MYIYSGDCRLCECGLDIDSQDIHGNNLMTGDIVMTYLADQHGISYLGAMTAIVADQFTSYCDGTYVKNKAGFKCYPMGIKNSFIDDGGEWKVMRVKKYSEVINGEKWKAYGFNYSDK